MDHKLNTALTFLQIDEQQFHDTGDARLAWRAWQTARGMKIAIPEWVLEFVDRLATVESSKRSRALDTRERYADALTQMELATKAHRDRVRIRDVAKSMGVDNFVVSRRDRPNLTAIARMAAKANGVSVNRLLGLYRARLKASRRVQKRRTPPA